MTLINTEGLSFIGPGSEWFWTAISAIVVAVTFLAILRQLQLQRSAAAIEQLNDLIHEWSSERLCRAKYNVLVAIQAGTKTADLPDRSVATVGFFWQRVGFLVRGGHIDRELVYTNLGDQAQVWWKLMIPEDSDRWQDFAWFVGVAAALDRKRGTDLELDPDSIKASIPSMIVHFRDAIEMEEALRSVSVRLPETPIAVTSARREPAEIVAAAG